MRLSTSARSGLMCTSPATGIRLISKSIAILSTQCVAVRRGRRLAGSLDGIVATASSANARRHRGRLAVVERGRVRLGRRGRPLALRTLLGLARLALRGPLLVRVGTRSAPLVGERERPLAVEAVETGALA